MENNKETALMQAKIASIIARVFGLSVGEVKDGMPLDYFLGNGQEGLRSFVVRLEDALKFPVGETALERCRTVGELAAYCAAQKASMPSGRPYVVVCRLPGGKICERHYWAKRHEAAAQLAMEDGAEEVLSVEREDREDEVARKKVGIWSKFVFPLIIGLIVAVAGVAFFWWRRGCPRLW